MYINRIIIFTLLLLFSFSTLIAQEENKFVLKGIVYDEMSEPIPGASIYIKDRPGIGTTSDINGNFELGVTMYDQIIISFIGYKLYEYRVTQVVSNLEVQLELETETLDEVVVVGMGTQRRISLAGAISSIEPAELEVPSTNIINTLAGRVAGIIAVQQSGEPGKNISEFWVRGIGTFGANSGALVLIDGLEGSLSSIDAADVESFSVLKDAAATAVYGSRGANGVVLVTTKKGLEQKLRITARINHTVSQLKRLPEYVDAYQYAQLANESAVASGIPSIYNDTELEIIRYELDPDLYPNINWQKEILNPVSYQQTYYISAQGGSSTAKYFTSLGMSRESSAYRASQDSKYNNGVGYNTYNYRLNLDINMTNTSKIYVGVTGFLSDNTRPSMGSDELGVSLTDWLWSSQAKTTPLSFPLRYSNGFLPASDEGDDISPYVLLNYTGNSKDRNINNLATIAVEQDLSSITEGLSAKVQTSLNNISVYRDSRYKMPSLWMATGRTPNGSLIMSERVQERTVNYANNSSFWRRLYMDASINYDRLFGNHRIGGLLFYYIEDTAESGASSSMNAIPRRYQSLSGRFTYGLKDTYFLDLNFGLNGSENFQPGKQYGFFPAAAASWVPTSYDFMKESLSWLSFLKFRASYGVVGNDRISDRRFPYLTIIGQENSARNRWGAVGKLDESQVGADNLVWEKAEKIDFGIDFHLLDDKFKATFDYFIDRRENIFQQRTQVPEFVGAISLPYGNVGSMKSWGGDGNIEFHQKLGSELYLTLRGNFTLARNKILNWEENEQPYPYLERNGYPHDVERGLVAIGLFKDQRDVEMSPPQFGTVRPGDIKYKDINGDGVITDDDRVPLFPRSGVPQLMYGMGGSLQYKDFTLNVLLRGTGQNHFLYGNYDGYIPFNSGQKGNVLKIASDPRNRWISSEYSGDPSTENPDARFPRLYYGNNENNARASTFWMGDARYLRLQELSLSYRLNSRLLQNMLKIQSMDIQLMGENLAVWDSVKIFDPEQAHRTGQVYPIPARYSLQLYLNF
ncbi:TonB-dependent receptor [uncultured Proteiniphilum sp.]|uniref:SusC/RagA family TonB-linked outer membrane protein n=1 Tax=uncultured Proteiniphilum sp. TaxID=497637 RepID=UPI00261BC96A|nr:TonB-dependent receptor [uncultured Proteiniphilum sp.]